MLASLGRARRDDRPRGRRRAVARRRDRAGAGDRRAAAGAAARTQRREAALEHLDCCSRSWARAGPAACAQAPRRLCRAGGRRAGDLRRALVTTEDPATRTRCSRASSRTPRCGRRHEPARAPERARRRRAARSDPAAQRPAPAGAGDRRPRRDPRGQHRRGAFLRDRAARRCCARGWPISCPSARRCSSSSPTRSPTQSTVNGYRLDVSTPRTGRRPARRRLCRAVAAERGRRDAAAARTVNC